MSKKIYLGGKDRPLDFNFNCLEEFEEMTGIDPLNGLKIKAKSAKALIFCGLKYGLHPEGCDNSQLDFDLKKVGSWLSAETIAAAMDAFNAQGQKEEEEKKSAAENIPV
jgi:hypothetical protein